MPPDMKWCRSPRHDGPNPLPVSQFGPNRGGLRSECRECGRQRSRQWKEANRDRVKQYTRQWYEANRARVRAAYRANLEEGRAAGRDWYHAHPEVGAARYASDQKETSEQATHLAEPWTQAEIEVAIRQDITAKQAALMLGRTFAGVQYIRKKYRSVPQGGQPRKAS